MPIYTFKLTQAARDGLARLHGEPQHAKKAKPEHDAGGDNLHTHGQEQVLDSLVSLLAGPALPHASSQGAQKGIALCQHAC